MVSQTVNIHQALRHLTNNQATAEVNGKTVGECLAELVERFPGIKPKLWGMLNIPRLVAVRFLVSNTK